jgi:hypothetical protein
VPELTTPTPSPENAANSVTLLRNAIARAQAEHDIYARADNDAYSPSARYELGQARGFRTALHWLTGANWDEIDAQAERDWPAAIKQHAAEFDSAANNADELQVRDRLRNLAHVARKMYAEVDTRTYPNPLDAERDDDLAELEAAR